MSSSAPRVVIWASAAQIGLLRQAREHGGIVITGVVSPREADSAALAKSLRAKRIDDLRSVVTRDDVDLLWLAAPDPIEPETWRFLRESGVETLTTEPRPGALNDLALEPAGMTAAPRFTPLFRRSPGFRAAADLVAEFAAPRAITVTACSGAGEGSLFARLFDAMDAIDALGGPVETIDAALVSPQHPRPASLDAMGGHLGANLRLSGGGIATLTVSDAAGGWWRELSLVGEPGRLRITDGGYELHAPGGSIERVESPGAIAPGALVAEHAARIHSGLDESQLAGPAPDGARPLALCEAARLSSRTGQCEAPARLRDAMRRP